MDVKKSLISMLRKSIAALSVVLKYPLLFSLLCIDLCVVVPFFLFAASRYGYYSIVGLILSQSPIIYILVKEMWRQTRMLPMSEAWEISPERWQRMVKEYTEAIKKKREDRSNETS